MFEVKFPLNHKYDGQVHQIQIKEAFEVYNSKVTETIVCGTESNKNIILALEYDENSDTYYFIPHTMTEFAILISSSKKTKVVTEELKRKLHGKLVTTREEMTNKDSIKARKEKVFFNNSKEKNGDKNMNNHNIIVDKIIDDKEQDVMDIFHKFYRRTLIDIKIFSDALIENIRKYKDVERLECVTHLLSKLTKTIMEVEPMAYLEDDMVDVGALLQQLAYDRVNHYNDEQFNEVINKGFEIIERLAKKPKERR